MRVHYLIERDRKKILEIRITLQTVCVVFLYLQFLGRLSRIKVDNMRGNDVRYWDRVGEYEPLLCVWLFVPLSSQRLSYSVYCSVARCSWI